VDLRRTTEEGELVDRSDAEKDRRHEYRVAAAALDLLAADLERAFGLDEVAPEAAVPSVDDPSLLDDAAGYILDQLSPEASESSRVAVDYARAFIAARTFEDIGDSERASAEREKVDALWKPLATDEDTGQELRLSQAMPRVRRLKRLAIMYRMAAGDVNPM
jgi:hypothetical protein